MANCLALLNRKLSRKCNFAFSIQPVITFWRKDYFRSNQWLRFEERIFATATTKQKNIGGFMSPREARIYCSLFCIFAFPILYAHTFYGGYGQFISMMLFLLCVISLFVPLKLLGVLSFITRRLRKWVNILKIQ